MSTYDQDKVAILGAGAMGLWIADYLATKNIPCVLIDEQPIASYSSTRNQGWLQDGGYYAIRGDAVAAAACNKGAAEVRRECPQAVHSDVACYYVFETEEARDYAVGACLQLGIGCSKVTSSDFEWVIKENPWLEGTKLPFAAKTYDAPVDTHVLLQWLANRAAANGAQFQPVARFEDLSLDKAAGGWKVDLGGGDYLTARVAVVAAGPCIPHLIGTLLPDFAADLAITKVPVLTVRADARPFTNAMFVAADTPAGPNIVPFRSVDGEGVTLCLAGADEDCDGRGAADDDQPLNAVEDFESVGALYPNFAPVEDAARLEGSIYMCQKLKSASGKRERLLSVVTRDDGSLLIAVYPGKFTASPTVAYECVEYIAATWPQSTTRLSPSDPPDVAKQRYYDEPKYQITTVNGHLSFEGPTG